MFLAAARACLVVMALLVGFSDTFLADMSLVGPLTVAVSSEGAAMNGPLRVHFFFLRLFIVSMTLFSGFVFCVFSESMPALPCPVRQ